MPKFEVEITKADIDAIREVLADNLEGDETDEEIIAEAFYFETHSGEADLRSKVHIKEMANSARLILRERNEYRG